MRPLLPVLLLLGWSALALAKKPEPAAAPPPPPAPAGVDLKARAEAFGAIDQLLVSGQKARAADGLVALVEDPSKSAFHAEAYARLGGVLEDLDLPYGALVAYQRALKADPVAVSSVTKNSIAIADKVGDTALLESVFAANVGLDVDPATRSRMAYLAARDAHHNRNYGLALAVLKMVQTSDPFYPEAKALEGVIVSMQGRPRDALAPLLTAQAAAEQAKKPARLINAIKINIARSYFAAENWQRAVEYYAQVERPSSFWPEAAFERAWSHFRATDINGALGQLQSLHSPFFEDWYFPEADMLRVYSLFLFCKFPDASKGINEFQAKYKPQLEDLRKVSARSPDDLYGQMRLWVESQGSKDVDLPRSITRLYEDEQRFLDDLAAIQHAEDEQARLKNVSANPFSSRVAGWVRERHDALIQEEGERIRAEAQHMAENLDTMLGDSEINKLDMMQFETRLYEQAAALGSIPEARKVVSRKQRAKAGQQEWPFQGEYWADELGYYRIATTSDCPASLRAGGEGAP